MEELYTFTKQELTDIIERLSTGSIDYLDHIAIINGISKKGLKDIQEQTSYIIEQLYELLIDEKHLKD